jgi:hypothetical protein
MHHFLINYYENKPFLVDMKNLDTHNVNKNCVFKTHCPFPQNKHKHDTKVLFMFGDIFNSVVSYNRKDVWGKSAAKHLFIDYGTNYLDEDLFKFQRHFENWTKKQTYPVMFVRYENLYDNLNQVLNFCGVEQHIKSFPPYKQRTTDWKNLDKETITKLETVYGELKTYVDSLPDIFIV